MAGNWYFVGLDLGQAQDFTAIAVLQRVERSGEWDPAHYAYRKTTELRLRFLKRIALGTPYPNVVAEARRITQSAELAGRCHLVVDGSGVGRPVVDLLRQGGLGCRILPVTITGGGGESHGAGHFRVPKRDLVTGLQTLLQTGGLQIAAGMAYGAELRAEMAEMRVKITAAGNTQFGAWREGTHDDLVLAVALACWGARRVYPRTGEGFCRREDAADWERALRKRGEIGQRLL